MATTRDGAAWTVLVERLANEPLAALAAEVEISVSELERRLTLADPGGSALRAPWWPEAVRRVMGGASLRATARCFGTNPRRLRRGLARAGLRVGGVDVRASGVPALEAYAAVLGTVPDGEVAAQAGVPQEAVQGQRRRLGVAPFFPERAVPAETPPEPRPRPTGEPVAKPRPRAREGRRPARAEASAPQVIRRASPARMGRAGAGTLAPDAVPPKAAVPTLNKGGLPVLAPRSPETASGGERRRRRLVRPDRPDEPEGATGGSRPAASAASARHGAVRVVLAKEPTLEPRAAAPRPQPPAEEPAEARSAPRDGPSRPTAEPRGGRQTAPPGSPSPDAGGAGGAPPHRAEADGIEVAPAESVPARAETAWRVAVDGAVQPFVVFAPDLARAVALVARRLPETALRRVSVWEAGPLL